MNESNGVYGDRHLIAVSGEAYSSRQECIAAISRLCTAAPSGLTIPLCPRRRDVIGFAPPERIR
jgi:hypothetical protein